jgi:hypothetical protein
MAYGVPGINRENREIVVAVAGLAADFSTTTAVAGAATLNDLSGKITTDSSAAVDGASYTLTITNNLVSANDVAFVSVALASGTALGFALRSVACTANTITITITNTFATTWTAAVFTVSYFVMKVLPVGAAN